MLSWLSAYSSRWVWPRESQRSTANNIHSVFWLSVGFTGRGVRVSCLAFSHTLDVYWVCLSNFTFRDTLCLFLYFSLRGEWVTSCQELCQLQGTKASQLCKKDWVCFFFFKKSVSKLTNWGTDMSKKAGYPHSVLIWSIKALSRLVCLQKDSHAVDKLTVMQCLLSQSSFVFLPNFLTFPLFLFFLLFSVRSHSQLQLFNSSVRVWERAPDSSCVRVAQDVTTEPASPDQCQSLWKREPGWLLPEPPQQQQQQQLHQHQERDTVRPAMGTFPLWL